MRELVLSATDQKFLQWLNHVEDPRSVTIGILKDRIRVICNDVFSVKRLWKTRYLLSCEKEIKLELYVRQKPYGISVIPPFLHFTTMIHAPSYSYSESQWATRNRDIFLAIPGSVFVHSADKDRGYPYLAVKPDLTEKRLNKPIRELIGQPIRITPEAIAIPKEAAIEEALRTQQPQQYFYDFVWESLLWNFKVDVVPLIEHNEVLVIVTDADERRWQRDYWLNRVDRT